MIKKVMDLLKDKDKTIQAIYEQMEEQLGEVPLVSQVMSRRPEQFIPHSIYSFFTLKMPKSLNAKTAELIAISAAAAAGSEHCLQTHINAALIAGAKMDEIYEAIMISALMSQTAVLSKAFRKLLEMEERQSSREEREH